MCTEDNRTLGSGGFLKAIESSPSSGAIVVNDNILNNNHCKVFYLL